MASPSTSWSASLGRVNQLLEVLEKNVTIRDSPDQVESAKARAGRTAQRKVKELEIAIEQLLRLCEPTKHVRMDECEERREQYSTLRSRAAVWIEKCAAGQQYDDIPPHKRLIKDTNQYKESDEHEDIVAAQDNQLDQLTSVIQRQRDIGISIYDEIDLQNQLIDELHESMDDRVAGFKSGSDQLREFLMDHRQGVYIGGVALLLVLVLVLSLLIII